MGKPQLLHGRLAGHRAAKRSYICLQCTNSSPEKVTRCMRCGGKVRHFASRAEAKRYLQLRQLEKLGVIRDLRMQVRFPCTFTTEDGRRVTPCTYIADFVYVEWSAKPHWVVEDVKGAAKFGDSASDLRRSIAEQCYNMQVKIISRTPR